MSSESHFPEKHSTSNASSAYERILHALHNRTTPLSEEEVRALLQALAQHPAELAALERFDPDSYCRNRVFSNQCVDILVLCWRPGQRTPIHDHAGSTCGVYVMRGEASEMGFVPSGMGPIIPSGTHTVRAGEITVSNDSDVHMVANYSADASDLVTLHCYSPPLQAMRVFGESETFFGNYADITARAAASDCYLLKP